MASTISKVCRELINQTGEGTIIFNDKMRDGRRSVKVWGWKEPMYQQAKLLLEQQGCEVEIVTFWTSIRGYSRRQTRMHVTE